jgi:hypothetical protein
MNKRKLFFILLIILLILVIGFFVWTKYYPKGEIKNEGGEAEGTEKTAENVSSLCEKFKDITVGIKCEKAIEVALNSYPGEVYEVDIVEKSAPNEKNIKEMWSVKINLKEPIETPTKEKRSLVNVLIDKNTGNISFTEVM